MKATILKLAETARFKAMMAYSFIIGLLCGSLPAHAISKTDLI